jgi:hypothetical protein
VRVYELEGLYRAWAYADADHAARPRGARATAVDVVDGNVHGYVSLLAAAAAERPPLACVWAWQLARDGYTAAAAQLLHPLGLDVRDWPTPTAVLHPTPDGELPETGPPPTAMPVYHADPAVPVHWVDDDETLAGVTASLAAAAAGETAPLWPAAAAGRGPGIGWVVAMDVEWQPSRARVRRRGTSPPALLQLAVAAVAAVEATAAEDTLRIAGPALVVLVDLLHVTAAALAPFLRALFSAPAMLKTGASLMPDPSTPTVSPLPHALCSRGEGGLRLGYGFDQDRSKLAVVAPDVRDVALAPYVDMARLDAVPGVSALAPAAPAPTRTPGPGPTLTPTPAPTSAPTPTPTPAPAPATKVRRQRECGHVGRSCSVCVCVCVCVWMRVRAQQSGLVGVVARWLGMRMDKRQQVSDWERRPLLPAQRAYAGTTVFPETIKHASPPHGPCGTPVCLFVRVGWECL